jgi:hypothetical protein
LRNKQIVIDGQKFLWNIPNASPANDSK